jgi:hypothetical protein
VGWGGGGEGGRYVSMCYCGGVVEVCLVRLSARANTPQNYLSHVHQASAALTGMPSTRMKSLAALRASAR